MSENPFENFSQPPQPGLPAGAAMPPRVSTIAPGALTPIAVIVLVLSILGIFGALVAFVAPLFIGFAEGVIESSNLPQTEKDSQLGVMDATKGGLMYGVAFAVVNLLFSIFGIVGAIQCLRKKGAGTLSMACLALGVWTVIQFILNIVLVQLPMQAKIKELGVENPGQEIGQTIGFAVGSVFVLGFVAFYIWGHIYTKSQPVKNYMASFKRQHN